MRSMDGMCYTAHKLKQFFSPQRCVPTMLRCASACFCLECIPRFMNDASQSLTTCTLIIKQVLQKYSDSYIFNCHSKFANCLTWPKKWTFYPTSFSVYFFSIRKIFSCALKIFSIMGFTKYTVFWNPPHQKKAREN